MPPRCGREQRIRPQDLIAGEHNVDEQRIALHRGHDAQRELEALVTVDHSHGGDARRDELDRVLPQPLHFHPEPAPIGHQKTEIADLRDVDARVVHLVDDARRRS